jgi:hypothetical protein
MKQDGMTDLQRNGLDSKGDGLRDICREDNAPNIHSLSLAGLIFHSSPYADDRHANSSPAFSCEKADSSSPKAWRKVWRAVRLDNEHWFSFRGADQKMDFRAP